MDSAGWVGEPAKGDDAETRGSIASPCVRSTVYPTPNLSMFQQLLELIIPNKPRSSKVQIPKPDKLTSMFTHGHCPL